ncbi:MAG: hypothetical protein AB8B93_12395 [Pseudomonadales bacterium]
MSVDRSVFESGFLGEELAEARRTGEYRLGDAAAELLASESAPELTTPDELTIKRRMRALEKRKQTNKSTYRAKGYPLAAAAAVLLVVIVGIVQFPRGQGQCGSIDDLPVLSCGTNQALTLASIDRAYPGGSLLEAFQAAPPVDVSIGQLDQALTSAGASYVVLQTAQNPVTGVSHGLVVATESEQEFDTLTGVLATSEATAAVADELVRIKEQNQLDWSSRLVHSVLSLVNIN